ncbi:MULTISPECIES: peptidase inhibitor family I36 protein [Yersinia]|uniref:peptidase inhibitor family I36 protein n=1 Tax=Yersinia TaxID=629 RepID=UPI0005DCFEBD|nr:MULTISPECIES: peptidase inhibitor family I36 protein [Yersinia]OVZ97456.1 exotoxin [Yersinia frederiksenii]RXA96131.1 exotoxin [Yersinia sp. 2105 StPb PI]CNI88063.1 beta-gamma-crystallin [Yersinia frederiksenii]CNJ05626.1 beta-gamma-crystallin [Yersinia frederiksenii]
MIKHEYLFLLMLFFSILSSDVYANEPKVCFYLDEDYQGESLCTTEGNAIDVLPTKWNDNISSIKIPKGMVVSVFKDDNFSGQTITFKDNVDSLSLVRWVNLDDEISSFKVRSAACFYELDKFAGNSFCLSGNETIDLYTNDQERHVVNPFNDRVHSIKLPQDTQVTIYKDDGYRGQYFVLMKDVLFDDLDEINMSAGITSIKVSQQEYFVCDQYCVVKGVVSIPLGRAFGTYWLDDRIKYKDALISFSFSGEDDYSIEIFEERIIKVAGRLILFLHKYHPENSFVFELDEKTDTLSFLLRFNGDYYEVQFVESIGTKVVSISPLVGSLFSLGSVDFIFRVNNINKIKPLIINKIVLNIMKNFTRTERSIAGITSCWLVPIISIYNYIVQGRCNQVDKFIQNVHDFFAGNENKILQIAGTAKPYPKINANDPNDFEGPSAEFSSKVEATLTHINTDMMGAALIVPATALSCNISMKEELLPNLRYRRDLSPACVEWTLNILSDFTLLFGSSLASWNAANFGRVIERIMKEGDIGHALPNNEVERRLIENVQTHLAAHDSDLIGIKTAFNFSQLSYADYLQHHDPEVEVHPPVTAQGLPLGRYELALQNFQFIETVPRIRRAGEWVDDPLLHFETEVISGLVNDTLAARQNVMPVINEWRQIYYQTKVRPLTASVASTSGRHSDNQDVIADVIAIDDAAIENAHSAGGDTVQPWLATNDTAIEAARLVSDVAQSWLRSCHDNYIFVVVRLAGRIISITMAMDISESNSGIAGSLTHPDYVLHPNAEGTIRGAGTAAIRALADYLSKKGKRSLVSDVISKPSAIVKKKVGFRFIGEL